MSDRLVFMTINREKHYKYRKRKRDIESKEFYALEITFLKIENVRIVE